MRSGAIARASSTSSAIVLSSMQVSDVRLRRTHRCAQHVPSTEADSDFGFGGLLRQSMNGCSNEPSRAPTAFDSLVSVSEVHPRPPRRAPSSSNLPPPVQSQPSDRRSFSTSPAGLAFALPRSRGRRFFAAQLVPSSPRASQLTGAVWGARRTRYASLEPHLT